MATWKSKPAKVNLGEVVRLHQEQGSHMNPTRGAETAVVVSTAEFAELVATPTAGSWVDRFRIGFVGDVELERDIDDSRTSPVLDPRSSAQRCSRKR